MPLRPNPYWKCEVGCLPATGCVTKSVVAKNAPVIHSRTGTGPLGHRVSDSDMHSKVCIR